MRSRMDRNALISLIESLRIDRGEYCVIASGALVLRGIWPDADDLDLAVTEEGLEQLRTSNKVLEDESGHYMIGDRVEFRVSDKNDWKTEVVDGYNVIDLEEYYKKISCSSREKDRERIPVIRNILENSGKYT